MINVIKAFGTLLKLSAKMLLVVFLFVFIFILAMNFVASIFGYCFVPEDTNITCETFEIIKLSLIETILFGIGALLLFVINFILRLIRK